MALWVLRDGGDRRELGRGAVVEGVGVNGKQRTDPIERADRYRPGHDRGNVTVQHRHAGGDGTPLGAVLQPSLELHERHGGSRHRRRCHIATPAHAATCAMRAWAAFQFQASSSCN